MFLVKPREDRGWGGYAVGLLVAEHGEQDVAAAAGQADECGVVLLALGSFAVVIGAADGFGAQCGECGQEQGSFEALVPGAGWELASNAGAERRETAAKPA